MALNGGPEKDLSVPELLEKHPGLSVSRTSLGELLLVKAPDAGRREEVKISVFTSRRFPGQVRPSVGISYASYRGFERVGEYSHIFATPSEDGALALSIDNRENNPGIEPQTVIADVLHGAKIMEGFLRTPLDERLPLYGRVFDWLGSGDLDRDMEELGLSSAEPLRGELNEMGMDLPDPSPRDAFRYFRKVLESTAR